MTTQRKITRPGMHDNEYMTVTCTPDVTAVEFFEFPDEAEGAARANLHPTTTTYMGKILKQGQHAVRGSSQHIAICVEVDAELRRALAARMGHRGTPSRELMQSWFAAILADEIQAIRRAGARDDEVTHPGVTTPAAAMVHELAKLGIEAVPPPTCSCHPGRKCSNWPECESCGPARQ